AGGETMKRILVVAVAIVALASLAATSAASSGQTRGTLAAVRKVPTVHVAGPQQWCGTNGVTCSDPSVNWDEIGGFKHAMQQGAPLLPYIGHDEPMVQFFSHRAGSGNNVAYTLRLPKDPPTRPRQDGSGGSWNFQQHVTFWFGMQLCDDQGSPNPDGAALSGHPTIPCKPDSDSNIY